MACRGVLAMGARVVATFSALRMMLESRDSGPRTGGTAALGALVLIRLPRAGEGGLGWGGSAVRRAAARPRWRRGPLPRPLRDRRWRSGCASAAARARAR